MVSADPKGRFSASIDTGPAWIFQIDGKIRKIQPPERRLRRMAAKEFPIKRKKKTLHLMRVARESEI